MELLAGAAFKVCLSVTSDDLVQKCCCLNDLTNNGPSSTTVATRHVMISDAVATAQNSIIQFAQCQLLKNKSLRDDYREFLELFIIFLWACLVSTSWYSLHGTWSNAPCEVDVKGDLQPNGVYVWSAVKILTI